MRPAGRKKDVCGVKRFASLKLRNRVGKTEEEKTTHSARKGLNLGIVWGNGSELKSMERDSGA